MTLGIRIKIVMDVIYTKLWKINVMNNLTFYCKSYIFGVNNFKLDPISQPLSVLV